MKKELKERGGLPLSRPPWIVNVKASTCACTLLAWEGVLYFVVVE
jgi:hypothetical protein